MNYEDLWKKQNANNAMVASAVKPVSTAAPKAGGNVRTGYTPGKTVTQAYNQYLKQQKKKPGAYTSQYSSQIQSAFDAIMNRPDFQYDMGADQAYQQMKDRYMQQGNMAMQDTMGQAAAMTGGYGSSYAQTAGQQMYNQNIQALNDQLPELMDRAYAKYRDQGQDMYQQLGMLQGQDDRDYGRYRDTVGDWQSELGRALEMYYQERGFDYNDFSRQDDKNFQLQLRNEQWAREDKKAAAGSGRGGGPNKDNGYTDEEIAMYQERLRLEQELERLRLQNQGLTYKPPKPTSSSTNTTSMR